MILIWLRLPTDPKDPPNPFTCWQVDPTKHMTDMTDFSCWYHMVSCHIIAYHGFRLQHSCSNPPGGGRDDGRIAAWAGGREIPGDWEICFVLLYWLTSVGANIFMICETHTFICNIIYYIFNTCIHVWATTKCFYGSGDLPNQALCVHRNTDRDGGSSRGPDSLRAWLTKDDERWRKMMKDDERIRESNWANWSDIDMVWPAKRMIYIVISADIKFARTYMNYLGD